MKLLGGRRKRLVVTVLVVAACLGLFTWQWTAAPRVKMEPEVAAQLRQAPPGALFLGTTFEGLPLRSVEPFLYSDCKPGAPRTSPTPCEWIRVADGKVTGSRSDQVRRARSKLRPVATDSP